MPATRVELPNPGDSLTMLVTACGKATAGNFPVIEFTGQDGSRKVIIELPEATVNRQFVRLEQNYKSIVGRTITLSRSLKLAANGKPFWDISVVGNGKAPPTTPASVPGPSTAQESPLPAPPEDAVVADGFGILFATYDRCFAHAVRVATRSDALGLPVDVAAVAAVLFIQAHKR